MRTNLLNTDIKTAIFRKDLKEAADTTYIVTLLVLTKFDDNVICTKNPVRPQKNCIFIVRKSSLEDERDIFSVSDGMGHWEKSKTKTMLFGKNRDNKIVRVLPEDDCFFENTWKVRRYIHYHRKSRDFHRVTIFVEGTDFIFVQYYFDGEEDEINTSNSYGNTNVTKTKKPHRRTKQSVKISARNLNIGGPKATVEKLFHKAGGFDNVRSNSDFPKNR